MASLARLSVDFVAKTSGFTRGISGAMKSVSTFSRGVVGIGRSLKIAVNATRVAGAAMFTALIKVTALVAPFVALGRAVSATFSQLQPMDDVADAAGRIGASVKGVTGLGHAFQLSGGSAEGAMKSLERMNLTIGKAKTGSAKATAAFANLGLSADDLSLLDPTDALKTVSDKLAGLPDNATQSAAAFAIFGQSAKANLSSLTAGSAAIGVLQANAAALGITFDNVDAAKVGKAVDALERMKGAGKGMLQSLAVAWSPLIESAAQTFTAWGVQLNAWVKNAQPMIASFSKQVMDVFLKVEFAITNIGVVWDLVVNTIRSKWETFAQDILFVVKVQIPAVFQAMGNAIGAMFKIIGANITAEITAVKESITSFSVVKAKHQDIGNAFKGVFDNLPKLAERPFTQIESDLETKMLQSQKVFTDEFDKFLGTRAGIGMSITPVIDPVDFVNTQAKDTNIATPESPAALMRGSTEAMSAVIKAQQSPMQLKLNEVAATLKKMLDVAKGTLDALEDDEEEIEVVLP